MPIPLNRRFTYLVSEADAALLSVGMRVAVPFGKRKIYTALVVGLHGDAPTEYEAKPIHQVLDAEPVVSGNQLRHWSWIASYYMCTLGEVFRAAVPSGFLLESETEILLHTDFQNEGNLTNDEFLIYEALQHRTSASVDLIAELLPTSNPIPYLNSLMEKGAIRIRERIQEVYRPKIIRNLELETKYKDDEALQKLLDSMGRAVKQREMLLSFFQLTTEAATVTPKQLLKLSDASPGVLKALVDKQILKYSDIQVDRVSFQADELELPQLSAAQKSAREAITAHFNEQDVVLLKGVTGSGKTAIYKSLIREQLEQGRQVLYLLPEIALTTQIIGRLEKYFGDEMSVYHSRYSMNERMEVWNNTLAGTANTQLILGARSALFLPFSDIGLIIVDEEHEPSFKQYDPAPRYHARDAAIVLANLHKAKVLLGSATPALNTYFNAREGKYGLVELESRFGDVMLPEIELVDLKDKYRKKRMSGHFSDRLIDAIRETLEAGEQVILFQNRRGYAPVMECATCGNCPQCLHCDVSLTYHRFSEELRCHYCGFRQALPEQCPACGKPDLKARGLGTEQIEMELRELFPDVRTGRMDYDTTRGKHGHEKIISRFSSGALRVLVGTQMLSKGLDFSNVTLAGVLNADNLLNFPDFRAHERTYQMLVQVAGRSGRTKKRGKVIIQTFNPHHQILQQVSVNDYKAMSDEQLYERRQYRYPPFYRMVRLTLRHRNAKKVTGAVNWLHRRLEPLFGELLLGPAIPPVGRIRNAYIRQLSLKIPPGRSLNKTKELLQGEVDRLSSIADFRSVRVSVDVDPL